MKKLIVLLGVSISGFPVFSQSYSGGGNFTAVPKECAITGKVKDQVSGNFVEYTSVAVFNQKDSSLVGGSISLPDGSFVVNNLPYGSLYIEASYVGYKKTRLTKISLTPQNKSVDVGTVLMEPVSTSLEAAEVVAQRPQIEYKIDKKVVTVDQNIVAAGGTAVDALENTPSVQVDIEGNVELRGSSNFTVLIDGRPSVLKGSEALQQLPVSSIQSIEIITNPSAKYDPEGSAGIINVIMKKEKKQGVNGIANANVSSNLNYGGDLLLNLRKNKVNYFLGGNYNIRSFDINGYSNKEIYNLDTTFYQIADSKGDFHRNRKSVKAGIEYTIDPKNNLSISGSLNNFSFGRTSDNKSHYYYMPSNDQEMYYLQNNVFDITRNSYELNSDYLLKFNDSGHQLEASVTWQDEKSKELNTLDQDTVNSNYQPQGQVPYHERTEQKDTETELRAKLDYSLPFSEKSKLDAGYQADIENSSGDSRFSRTGINGNEFVEVDSLYDNIDFNNVIHAIYATYSNQLGKILDFQAGLRVEYNDRLTVQNITGDRYEFKKWDYFPSLHLSKQLKGNFQIQASYSRRIDRPRGWELDPFKTYQDQYNIRMGNPYLEPEYTNSYELNAQKTIKKTGFVSLELFNRQSYNNIEHYPIVDSVTGVTINTFKNISTSNATGGELMVNLSPVKWWNLNMSVSGFNHQITDTEGVTEINKNAFTWNSRFNSTFRFKTGTQIQLMGFYRAPDITSQGERKGFFFTNLGLRQDFFKRQLTASLQVRDLLGMAKFEFNSSGPGYSEYFKRQRESQIVTLSLSYKINNFKQKSRRENGEVNEVEFDNSGEGGEMY